jgi:hypothetical protein
MATSGPKRLVAAFSRHRFAPSLTLPRHATCYIFIYKSKVSMPSPKELKTERIDIKTTARTRFFLDEEHWVRFLEILEQPSDLSNKPALAKLFSEPSVLER